MSPILSALLRRKLVAGLLIVQIALTLAIGSNCLSSIALGIELMSRDTGFPKGELFGVEMLYTKRARENLVEIRGDLEYIRGLEGVKAVAQVPMLAYGRSRWYENFSADDRKQSAGVYYGDEHYLAALGLELVEGRGFSEQEVVRTPGSAPSVVVVTRAFANNLFPDGDALGKIFFQVGSQSPLTIVGIVRNMQFSDPTVDFADNNVIYPMVLEMFSSYQVRARPEMRDALIEQVDSRIRSVNSDRVILSISALEDRLDAEYSQERANVQTLGLVNTLVFVVTLLSLFGIASYDVIQRRGQIGVRRALGAKRTDIISLFLIENAFTGAVGILLGIALAWYLNGWIVTQFEAAKIDWNYILICAAALAAMSQLAVLFPVLKAARISPAIVARRA